MSGLVTVVGATGAVGQAVTEFLHRHGVPLRLSGRREEAVRKLARGVHAEVAVADFDDALALSRACDGSAVVVNCAGPASAVGERVAVAARAADYVDAAGDDLLDQQLAEAGLPSDGRVAVLGAGMSPGLTGLLPRLLAGPPFTRTDTFVGYAGGRDRFTPAAAADYLASLSDGYGVTGAAWRDGRVVLATPRLNQPAPFFPGLVSAFPFLSGELRRVVIELGLAEASWFNVFDGQHTLALLGRLRSGVDLDRDESIRQLCRAAELDGSGMRPYQTIALEMTGVAGSTPLTRSLIARGQDAYRLTGAVAAVAAIAILEERLPAGRHRADAVLPVEPTVQRLRDWNALSMLEIHDEAVAEAATVEEGAL